MSEHPSQDAISSEVTVPWVESTEYTEYIEPSDIKWIEENCPPADSPPPQEKTTTATTTDELTLALEAQQLAAQFASLSARLAEKEAELTRRERMVEHREKRLREMDNKLTEMSQTDKIKLNVGGQLFITSKDTLLAEPDTFFYHMLRSERFLPDEGDAYFIDRDPKFVQAIINYLRQKQLFLDPETLPPPEQVQFANDIDFFSIDSLREKYGELGRQPRPTKQRVVTRVFTREAGGLPPPNGSPTSSETLPRFSSHKTFPPPPPPPPFPGFPPPQHQNQHPTQPQLQHTHIHPSLAAAHLQQHHHNGGSVSAGGHPPHVQTVAQQTVAVVGQQTISHPTTKSGG
eukprot:TRINITY_DN68098_c5_g1_i1.p1 TRINITY_DN68098_c5_g1~~TRINITY_DN68098_c5_g1_i1.p1  ORF type:complete len:345 (+),score=48.65 TRINITY_DN68098_c5_g1_i1:21-1055(+)